MGTKIYLYRSEILKACDRAEAFARDRYEKRIEPIVDQSLANTRQGFLDRLFRRKPVVPDREAVREAICYYDSRAYIAKEEMKKTIKDAERLRRVAELSVYNVIGVEMDDFYSFYQCFDDISRK